MSNSKLLSAICYLSIFFFPLFIPFIIYFITNEKEVKLHAKRSFISHIIPVILLLFGMFFFSLSMFSVEKRMLDLIDGRFFLWSTAPFLFSLLYSALLIVVYIWNGYHGIKLLKTIRISI